MPPMEFPVDTKFYIEMHFVGQWKYKNGNNKRADIQNLIKILIDAIFEKIGRDDSWVYSLAAYKIQDEKEAYTKVRIETL